MTGDLEKAVAMLAADNCRLIDIALAADALASAAERQLDGVDDLRRLEDALAKYRQVSRGQ